MVHIILYVQEETCVLVCLHLCMNNTLPSRNMYSPNEAEYWIQIRRCARVEEKRPFQGRKQRKMRKRKMSLEEAHAVHSVLWLIEMSNMDDPSFLAMKRVQDAIGMAMDFPIAKFRSDKSSCFNNESSVYIYSRD